MAKTRRAFFTIKVSRGFIFNDDLYEFRRFSQVTQINEKKYKRAK